jgi:hypothetical protein
MTINIPVQFDFGEVRLRKMSKMVNRRKSSWGEYSIKGSKPGMMSSE